MKSPRRERLVGHRYQVGALTAELRKSCRDEMKILYTGARFDLATWERLRPLGALSVFEASRLNPVMKDLVRVVGEGLRLEGARDGELLVAFFAPGGRGKRRRALEALLSAPG